MPVHVYECLVYFALFSYFEDDKLCTGHGQLETAKASLGCVQLCTKIIKQSVCLFQAPVAHVSDTYTYKNKESLRNTEKFKE